MIRPSHSRSRVASLPSQPSRLSVQTRLALITGGVMMASMSLSGLGLASARADEKSDRRERQYKVGATVLGGAALYYGIKKKNAIGAAAAGAGAYYAYKKGQEANRESGRDRYGRGNPRPGADTDYDSYPEADGRRGRNRNRDRGNRDHQGYPVDAPRDDYDASNDSGYPRDVSGDDYGSDYGDNGPDYARNGDDYPDYGLNGLSGRRGESKRGASGAPHSRRITVK